MKKILLVLAVIVFAFLAFVASQPSHFEITRSVKISAPAKKVFPMVNDFHNWAAWSPWAKMDLAAKNTYEGPESGVGAMFSWVGNNKVGEGKMTIVESRPKDYIQIKLDFLKPMKATNKTEFTFKSESRKETVVTWTMSGENNFIGKAMSLIMNCEKMVGGEFEKGLASIKSISEAKR